MLHHVSLLLALLSLHVVADFARFKAIVEVQGYVASNYNVTTSDGYILTLLRIQAKYIKTPGAGSGDGTTDQTQVKDDIFGFNSLLARNSEDRQENVDVKAQTVKYNKALLLMHAEDFNAEGWVTGRTAQETLPFLIADLGYDVWLGNNRGVKEYSRHETFTESDRAYWEFSFAEMGMHDVSALINLVLQETGLK